MLIGDFLFRINWLDTAKFANMLSRGFLMIVNSIMTKYLIAEIYG